MHSCVLLASYWQPGHKVCGFLSLAESKGWSKFFPGSDSNTGVCYSGSDRSLWVARSNSSHRTSVEEVLKCTTKTKKTEERI